MIQSTATSYTAGPSPLHCRLCGTSKLRSVVDLGMSPLANSYVRPEQLNSMEPFFPLHLWICESCFLVQLPEFESPENIFTEYAYFSSYSNSWLEHARRFATEAILRFGLNPTTQVVEIASNDGYLLQHFQKCNISVLGIEPAQNVAEVARQKGIPTLSTFFGADTARGLVKDDIRADLLVAINVLMHVPHLNDFIAGLKTLLKSRAVLTVQFGYLVPLVTNTQFDYIYHEHFSYFTLLTAEAAFARHGLAVFDVEQLPVHGGSLRIYLRHTDDTSKPTSTRVDDLKAQERELGVDRFDFYEALPERVQEAKRRILEFLIGAKRLGKTIVGYGAPAKGNTLLNYCGVRTDLIDYTVDANPAKQDRFLPGTHIPIYSPDKLSETKPDYVLILPWNLREEIVSQRSYIRGWGGKFVVPLPNLEVLD